MSEPGTTSTAAIDPGQRDMSLESRQEISEAFGRPSLNEKAWGSITISDAFPQACPKSFCLEPSRSSG